MTTDLLYKVAYDEAVRALAEQQEVIDSFHTRAGLLFSATAITTSFLGTEALGGGDLNFASWAALLCFVAVAAASLAVLWPREWNVTADLRDVIDTYIESAEPAPIEDLHRELSLHMRGSHLENRKGIRKLIVLLQVASVLLAVEVVLWIVAIAMASWEMTMDKNEKPAPRAEPKRPSPMMTEPGMTLREAIEILTPRWLKRSSRRHRSS